MPLKTSGFVLTTNEVVIALVQPTGTDLNNFRDRLKEAALKLSSELDFINLTDFTGILDLKSPNMNQIKNETDAHQKIEHDCSHGFQNLSKKMHLGTSLRKNFRKDIFSIFGLAKIMISRDHWLRSAKEKNEDVRLKKKIYILDSLKHPDEVDTLREVYGKSFWLIGISAERSHRVSFLKSVRGVKPHEASELIYRDEDENLKYGQKMNDAYECADFFFNESCTQLEIDRFLEIVFDNSKIAPTRDEQYMHMAASIAAQSSDLSRQVGAVLVSEAGEILAVGCNDVPKFPGGQYKEGDNPDFRDVTMGSDPNHKRRDQILEGMNSCSQKDPKVIDMIKNLTEYHRAVHAEMEAIISCARKGISTVGATIYTTTYPCHNCAKHLLNAGIQKAIYIQAYPKSLALELHNDSICESANNNNKMSLQRYVGMGPRKYLDYFSLSLSLNNFSRKGENVDKDWKTSVFDSRSAQPKFTLVTIAAIESEKLAMKYLYDQNIVDQSNEFHAEIKKLKAA